MFDIATQSIADTADIHIKGANGEYLYDANQQPACITVYSPGSRAFAAVEERQTQRAVKRMEENDGKIAIAPKDQRDREQVEDLAAITVGFKNFTYSPAGDKQGVALFEALYADKSLGFIPPQILKALRDWGKFLPISPAS